MPKRQTLARIVRAGAEEMLPRQLALLEQICAIDSGTGNEAGNAAVTGLLEPVLSELGARTERVRSLVWGPIWWPGCGRNSPGERCCWPPTWTRCSAPALRKSTPFILKGEWAHGLGAGDCKSGVLISLFGALILKKGGPAAPLGADVPFHL